MKTGHPSRWYTFVLLPVSGLYRAAVGLRNFLFDLGVLPSREFRMPVISVGNITVGGTGKTPHVEYLLRLLSGPYKTASLSRGYKRKTKGFQLAGQNSSVDEIGDESRQISLKFPEVKVAVDSDRVNALRHLMTDDPELGVVVLDDAYQYRFVKPGLSILLIDFNQPITEDHLLPAGRLREPASGRSRADIIIVTKCPEKLKPIEYRDMTRKLNLRLHQHLFFTTVDYGELRPVYPQKQPKSFTDFKAGKTEVLMVTGIANPRPMKKYARSISPKVSHLAFPDHHSFTMEDMELIHENWRRLYNPDALILTTEKDAMRLQMLTPPEEIRPLIYYVDISIRFLNNEGQEFNQIILNYVRSNKRDSILYKGADRKKA
ncbi:MAG: tetraacyldisaccharide 4'-kinase [Bacteroidota bacterium]